MKAINQPLNLPDDFLGLYIHIPFCLSKCHYCDFISHASSSNIDHFSYLNALKLEAKKWQKKLKHRKVNSLYIGGGTPSILSNDELDFLFNDILQLFNFASNAEKTIEINPKTIDNYKLNIIAKNINRISIGVQSFNDNELNTIGRAHNAKDAKDAINMIKSTGINFSLDLIFGLPSQTKNNFKKSLEKSLSFSPSHISLYSLMLCENTKMDELVRSGDLILPNEELVLEMWEMAEDILNHAGYSFYEVANVSKPGFHSTHNLGYWLEREYIGLGLSSSSYYNNFRFKNTSKLKDYISNPISSTIYAEKLSNEDTLFEGIMMGLRLKNGFYTEYLEKKSKLKLANSIHPEIINKDGTLRLSETGFKVANQIMSELEVKDILSKDQ